MKSAILAGLLLVVSLGVIGCGSGSDDTASENNAAPVTGNGKAAGPTATDKKGNASAAPYSAADLTK